MSGGVDDESRSAAPTPASSVLASSTACTEDPQSGPPSALLGLEHNQELRIPVGVVGQHVFVVPNEVQSTSCVLFYLQCGANTPASCAVVELFYHATRVKLQHAMKYAVQLGYVVATDLRRINNTLGFRYFFYVMQLGVRK